MYSSRRIGRISPNHSRKDLVRFFNGNLFPFGTDDASFCLEDPSLVFSEFMGDNSKLDSYNVIHKIWHTFVGVIKGSEQALDHAGGFLDQKTYCNLSHRSQSTFAHQRNTIYAVFQLYLKRKRDRGECDPADRWVHSIRHLSLLIIFSGRTPSCTLYPNKAYLGRRLIFCMWSNFNIPEWLTWIASYVDEVQDNLLIDALREFEPSCAFCVVFLSPCPVLRSMCRNPDGLFWAGDTAQTISVGSSFKFNDLKAFLFRIEVSILQFLEGFILCWQEIQEKNVASGEILHNIVQPRSFQLAVNYRSHGGIVNCAHSVVDLITRFWPHAIDILAQEKGIVDGLKPVFFHGWNSETVRYEQFLFGASWVTLIQLLCRIIDISSRTLLGGGISSSAPNSVCVGIKASTFFI